MTVDDGKPRGERKAASPPDIDDRPDSGRLVSPPDSRDTPSMAPPVRHALTGERLAPCKPDSPRLDGAEIALLAAAVPGWRVVEQDNIVRLERTYRMPSYPAALGFTVGVGRLAEAADHHPSILTEFGRVTVRWWTWTVRGLHRNDFVMAARTDRLFDGREWVGE